MVLDHVGSGKTRFHQLVSFGARSLAKDILTKDIQNIMTMLYYLNRYYSGYPTAMSDYYFQQIQIVRLILVVPTQAARLLAIEQNLESE